MSYARDDRVIDRGGLLFLLQDEYDLRVQQAEHMTLSDETPPDVMTMQVALLMREAHCITGIMERISLFTKHAPSPPDDVRYEVEPGWMQK